MHDILVTYKPGYGTVGKQPFMEWHFSHLMCEEKISFTGPLKKGIYLRINLLYRKTKTASIIKLKRHVAIFFVMYLCSYCQHYNTYVPYKHVFLLLKKVTSNSLFQLPGTVRQPV